MTQNMAPVSQMEHCIKCSTNVIDWTVGGYFIVVALINVTHHIYHQNTLTWFTTAYKLIWKWHYDNSCNEFTYSTFTFI